MNVVFGLIGVTVVLLVVIAMVMLWAIRSGQFEDMEGPAWRVVMDDDRADPDTSANHKSPPVCAASNPERPDQADTTNAAHDTPKT